MDSHPDQIGPVPARVYRTRAADGVELAVTRLGAAGEGSGSAGPAVVLVHGSYSQRSFFVSPKGIGLGPYLLAAGFDVWIPEMRGHGRSPRSRGWRHWTAEDQLRHDVPAIQALLEAEGVERAHWCGHSFGGLAIIGALGARWLDPERVRTLTVLGANITEGDPVLRDPIRGPLLRLAARLLGRIPAKRLGLGPEPESASYLDDFFRWKGRHAAWATREGRSYWAGLRELDVPLLAFAAVDDPNDPPAGCRTLFDAIGSPAKAFVLLGKATGFSMDYGHVDMIVSKAAQAEVYPRIAAHMRAPARARQEQA